MPLQLHATDSVHPPTIDLYGAARHLVEHLAAGRTLSSEFLRSALETTTGGTDADGAWNWKHAYDAAEAAFVLFIERFGPALIKRTAGNADTLLALIDRIAQHLPKYTRRSAESVSFQQFSTPPQLALAVYLAATLTPTDTVLEPSAGTGILAAYARLITTDLHINEIAPNRLRLLRQLFPQASVTDHDAAAIDDYLVAAAQPSVVLMNPPFSALVDIERRSQDATARHVLSALARLQPGGRLVAITGHGFDSANPTWKRAFATIAETATPVFSAPIAGAAFAAHGTTFPTRLTVIDKTPAIDVPVRQNPTVANAHDLIRMIAEQVPPRLPVARSSTAAPTNHRHVAAIASRTQPVAPTITEPNHDTIEVEYDLVDTTATDAATSSNALYQPYCLQSIRIPRAKPHPTALVQSAAMASVSPPRPSYRPRLPASVIDQGLLSDAQLETVIYAGEAHGDFLPGAWIVDPNFDKLTAAKDEDAGAVRFRRGYYIGDGTGVGKGRQAAGIILDNWLSGRRRAVWISKSDKLLEDAQRDWSALGQEPLLIRPLSATRQGAPVGFGDGILFTTFATLRSEAKPGRKSRIQQIVDWFGPDFDGVIVLDEAHELRNAVADSTEFGDQDASQQGRAGVRLQNALPAARIVYQSATGATTVRNFAYATRLGLWGGVEIPFASQADFIEKIDAGGVAAMEVLARDLKSLGLYTARSLSYEGVTYDMLVHELTPDQVRTYNAYAEAFRIIHSHLDAALKAANIASTEKTLNRNAKAAAHSQFESAKQRFFNHLITAMTATSLIPALKADLDAGHAPVIQIISTGEALMERRLAEIPSEDYGDLQVDITPREYVLDYLAHSFPVQLYRTIQDPDGQLQSIPVFKDGQPVICRDAVRRRDGLIQHLAALDPIPAALDQIIQSLGTDTVAEVTGRSRRIVSQVDSTGRRRLLLEARPASANLTEAQAFMDDKKRVLVFSEAGGTGRSYHADLGCQNKRQRVHYLLEAGWRADVAIQGLGRSHRTHQQQPPIFRPVAAGVKAQKRFLSTIARRLDTLGALTRGQRQTGGQGLFRPEDNLEGPYAREALRSLYSLVYQGKIDGCSFEKFEEHTGLRIADHNGLLDKLPPITTFLNRLLALTIDMQDVLFTAFEALLERRVRGAIASGTYDCGVETITAESIKVADERIIHTHKRTGAPTQLTTLSIRERNHPRSLEQALSLADKAEARLVINERSHKPAVLTQGRLLMEDDGSFTETFTLYRPLEILHLTAAQLAKSHWQDTNKATFRESWTADLATVPEFRTTQRHLVTGMLLPIWNTLPPDAPHVFRLTTDDGRSLIGREVSPGWAGTAGANLETTWDLPKAVDEVLSARAQYEIRGSYYVRRAKVAGEYRIEIVGHVGDALERLIADGCFTEILQWKTRVFIPSTPEMAVQVLERIVVRHPIIARIELAKD